jgi:DNA-binding HxlR family transcriptional regulator
MRSHRCRKCAPVPEEVRRAADLLERRWTVSILWAAHSGAVRFNEFRQSLGRVPPRTLAQRLADLQQAGLLERSVIDSRPPRVEYRLTETGRKLEDLLDAVGSWARARS